MLIVSLILITLSAGLTLMSALFYVGFITIKTRSDNAAGLQQVVILGKKLINNRPDKDYLLRLKRALTLDKRTSQQNPLQIHILGGFTGHSKISESSAGRNYLLSNSIKTTKIHTEEVSRDTLDNLKQLKNSELLSNKNITLITNRYHLARASLMAQGFGFIVEKCAAEDSYTPGIFATITLFSEAFFLHWYLSGRFFAKLTHNRRMLARIE